MKSRGGLTARSERFHWQMMMDMEITLSDEEATSHPEWETPPGSHALAAGEPRFAVAFPQRKAPQNPDTGFRQLVMEHSENGMETRIAVLLSTKPLQIEVRELSWR
jgi:hypothetical protein